MGEIERTEHELVAEDGARFFTLRWMPPEPTAGGIVICHGMGEHIGRYDHLARHLCGQGYAVAGLDHRGFGRSSGVKGHIDSFEQYTADLDRFVGSLIDDEGFPTEPLVLIGHSMGGLIAALYRVDHPARPISATVLSGPLAQVAVEVPGWKATLGNVLAGVLPRLRMATGLDTKLLSHNAEVVRAYEEDPLVYGQVSARWFVSMHAALERLHRDAGQITGPVLIAFGEEDGLCHPDGARRLYDELATEDKKLIAYPGLYHEIFNETSRQEVYDDVVQWLGSALGA